MDSERWKQVDKIFAQALEQPTGERNAYVRSACQGDEELNREVQSLLRSQQMAGGFLQSPAMELAARELAFECNDGAVDDSDFSLAPAGADLQKGLAGPSARCRACSFPIPDGARYCAGCGIPLVAKQRSDASLSWPHSTTPYSDGGQLPAGTVIANRYTALGLVGRGGMGEVYKAHDSKLDQVVALKLLPRRLRWDAAAVARLHQEVRIARRVSHPNACRVYDVGEADDFHFLTMEFIDGEDLAHLLKRIGRFPQDKGVEIARKLSVAIAAAHACGVLHRDLKPSNVMLTDTGQVLVTDFGLSAVAGEVQGAEIGCGTPAYMSPEQLEGREVTARSDIYSLGLVLYEIFTGKRAYDGKDRGDYSNPSSLVKDLDPAVERVILQCLGENPNDRPANALTVASALPGGDLLQTALAAGQTPSPEMVAASGEESGINPRAAAVCFAAVFLCLFAAALLRGRTLLAAQIPLELSPEVLAFKSREIAATLGYNKPPLDTAYGFAYDSYFFRQLATKAGVRHMKNRRPTLANFWYRESPWWLGAVAHDPVTMIDPPVTIPGMIVMRLDTLGRLSLFQAVPPVRMPSTEPRETEWKALFTAGGLDIGNFQPVAPEWLPLVSSDVRKAWTGTYPDQPDMPIRVEAASLAGKPVYFRIAEPWVTGAFGQSPVRENGLAKVFSLIVYLTVAGLAWQNFKTGFGDRRGAFRFGVCMSILRLIYLAAMGYLDHYFSLAQRYEWTTLGDLLFFFALAWAAYIALEPVVRRHWPHSLVSWSRMLAGGLRDPLLGRDILIGVAGGCVSSVLYVIVLRGAYANLGVLPVPRAFGLPSGTARFIGVFAGIANFVVTWALLQVVLFVTAWRLVRSKLFAALLIAILAVGFWASYISPPQLVWLNVLLFGILAVVQIALLLRFGMTAFVFALFTGGIQVMFPLGLDFSAWHQYYGRAAAVVLIGLAFYGFQTALAGRSVFDHRVPGAGA
jgi:serine/threonine-protein kinase